MSLTRRQQAFIRKYCSDPKAGQAQAAMRAGYSPLRAKETASELMRHPEVAEAIKTRLERRIDKALDRQVKLTPEVVLAELDEIRDAAIEAGIGNWQAQTRLKAVELKCRYLGMLKDKVEIGLDDQLIKRLEEGRKKAFQAVVTAEPVQVAALPDTSEDVQ